MRHPNLPAVLVRRAQHEIDAVANEIGHRTPSIGRQVLEPSGLLLSQPDLRPDHG